MLGQQVSDSTVLGKQGCMISPKDSKRGWVTQEHHHSFIYSKLAHPCLLYLYPFICSNKNIVHSQFFSFVHWHTSPTPIHQQILLTLPACYIPTCLFVSFSDFTLVLGLITSYLNSSKILLIYLPTSTLVLFIIHYPKATRVIFQKCKWDNVSPLLRIF